MKYCSNCGKEVSENQDVCLNCGKSLSTHRISNSNDVGGFGWGLLGFCVPLVGLILYLVWKDTQPKNASAAGKGALISVIVSVLFYIIYIAIISALVSDYSGF
jgi:hypothetical protein